MTSVRGLGSSLVRVILVSCLQHKLSRPCYMGSKVPSPTHVSKSQHGCKVPTFEPQEPIKIWLINIKFISHLFYAKILSRHLLRVGSRFLLDPILNTSPKPHLQKVLPCRHPCRTWDLGLGIPCEVVSPNSQAFNGWDWTDWPQVTWDLVWTGLNILHLGGNWAWYEHHKIVTLKDPIVGKEGTTVLI